MPKVFRSVMKRYNLAAGDFPDLEDFRSKLLEQDFSKFHSLRQKLLDDVEVALGVDLPRLMEALPRSHDPAGASAAPTGFAPLVYEQPRGAAGGASAAGGAPVYATTGSASDNPWAVEEDNPFDDDEEQVPVVSWALDEHVPKYKAQFDANQSGGLMSAATARTVLTGTGVPKAALKKIWELSDVDKDGSLDLSEFVIAMYLVGLVKQGLDLPPALDVSMTPLEKRR